MMTLFRCLVVLSLCPYLFCFTCSVRSLAEDNQSKSGEVREGEVPQSIFRYIERPEPDYQWKKVSEQATDAGRLILLQVTSQKWHDIVWKHSVEVYVPPKVQHPGHALLFVNGGSSIKPPREGDLELGLKLASACGAPVIMLRQVPNQPLFDGRKEDDLITETWLRYLESGDDTWPLLFPMVKSAVKTMDAVGELSEQELGQKIDRFVITGASKRGWTSWLTPVADSRVIATAPIVIDVLNFRAQMTHQLESWGKFSEQIIDYTSKGLVKRPDETETPREVALREMMDPWTYRERVQIPKLLIVGTNDPYWCVDAMNIYWDDLVGPKYIRQVPNAGHGLEGGKDDALKTLAVFFRHAAAGKPLPQITWSSESTDGRLSLSVESPSGASRVVFWKAVSEDLDFRDDKWQADEVNLPDIRTNLKLKQTVSHGEGKHLAIFAEVGFEFEGIQWSQTTLVYRQ